MYKELDDYLSLEWSVDHWYDEGCLIAGDILSRFSDNDWNELVDELFNQSVEWQIRLAYCLDQANSKYVIKCLLLLTTIDDDELFFTSMESLRSIAPFDHTILQDESVMDKINDVLPKFNRLKQIILSNFIEQAANQSKS